ncbi:MAG: helix-turn-helix domain-containing protein [Candidatus Latescibacterota bacterium]|nr:MAG: helix-turn-helix domain-containing protein [Candidatus Latescibacterota bacterium]
MSENPTSGEAAGTVGEILKSRREKKKLSLAQVNEHTKLSVDVLRSIEQDDFGSFESEIYLKGFLRNYAKFLGLDVDYVLQLLEGQRGGAKSTSGTMWDIEASVREEKLTSPRILNRIVVPLLILVVIILSILLALEKRKVKELQSNLGKVSVQVESVGAPASAGSV